MAKEVLKTFYTAAKSMRVAMEEVQIIAQTAYRQWRQENATAGTNDDEENVEEAK